jgi:heat shock protein HtpX
MKRIALMLVANLAIIIALGIVWSILDATFGISQMIESTFGVPGRFGFVAFFALILGFGGSFLSLLLSKWMAKRSMGVFVIDQAEDSDEQWLLDTVHRQARDAGIGLPEVGIFESPEPNAFATGASKNNALVAVSTGLLQHMNHDQVEAVLAHEVSHIANGDMITQALLQGVLNTFVMFFARVIGYMVDKAISGDEESSGFGIAYFITSFIMDILLGWLANLVVMWYSRRREFFADAGGAKLAGKHKMISALQALQRTEPSDLPGEMAAFGISGGMASLTSTHPSLDDRIAALEKL